MEENAAVASPQLEEDVSRGTAAVLASADAHRQQLVRQWSWALVWLLPAVLTIVGIVLTSGGTVEVVSQYEETYVTLVAVWPAGLTLLGVGLLGLMAAAILNVVRVMRALPHAADPLRAVSDS